LNQRENLGGSPLPPIEQLVQEIRRSALSPAETATALHVSRQTVYNLIERGELRRFKVGGLTRIPVADVLALIGGGDAPAA